MKVVRIQDKTTMQVTHHFIDGKRVSKTKCGEEMMDMRGYNSSLTETTKSGKYRHIMYLDK